MMMDPTVVAACDLAVKFVFGPTATYRPIGSAADTAFSGSAVVELEVVITSSTTSSTTTTTSVVLKHSSVRTLSESFVTISEDDDNSKSSKKYAAALKVDRSSRNEYAFLQSYSDRLLLQNKIDGNCDKNEIKTKTRIPRTLFARNHPTEGITLLLESLSSFGCSSNDDNDNSNHSCGTNVDSNDETTTTTSSSGRVNAIPLGPKMNATLEWIANFHANFLPRSLNPNTFCNDDNGDLAAKEDKEDEEEEKKLVSLMWSIGSHLSLEKRSPIELEQLPIDLTEFVERFQNDNDNDNDNDNENENENENNGCCEYFQTQQAKQHGQRIQDVAVDVAKYLHPDNNPTHKTIVHGDYKQGNMFFAANNNTAATASGNYNKDNENDAQIAVFDWQWTGPGLGATDLVYLCVMAVSDEALVDYETNILRPYHKYLIQALAIRNSKNNNNSDDINSLYPYQDLINQFKIAMIDIQRWMGGSRYKSMTPETVQRSNQSIDVNHGIFRRSMKRIVWIFKTVDLALDDVESGRIQLLQ
jgi:hypothetical protein